MDYSEPSFDLVDGPPLTYPPRLVMLVEKATNKVECVYQVEGSMVISAYFQKRLTEAGFELQEHTAKGGLSQDEWEAEMQEFMRAHGNPTPPSIKVKGQFEPRKHNHSSDCKCQSCLRQIRLDAEQSVEETVARTRTHTDECRCFRCHPNSGDASRFRGQKRWQNRSQD